MVTFQMYLLKSALALSLLYSFYWFFLRNETYYSWNRFFLLVSLIVSFLFPVFSFSIQSIPSGTYTNLLDPVVVVSGYLNTIKSSNSVETLSILSIIYISGAVFFCLRFLSSLARIHFLYTRFPKYTFNGFKAVVLDNDQSPFTFFNILFISRIDFERGKIDEMIVHEKAHKDEFHTFDILLLEAMTILQWFNPFIWLFRHALKSEHEFIADNKVMKEGFDKVKYQKLLFERSLGITSFSLTNNFNYSLLKKRLKMMTINKSSSKIKIKYLVSMPILLFAIVLMALNFNSFGQTDKVYTDVDVMAKYQNGSMEGIAKFIQQNITYPNSARENNISARVYVQFVVDENGKVANVEIVRKDILDNSGNEIVLNEIVVKGYESGTKPKVDPKSVTDIEAESIRVIKLLEGFTPAKKDGENVKTQFVFPINFILGEKKV
jgi:hypothetical protein